jgi:hypothetical protein
VTTKYLTTAETAALIRTALRDTFPGVKFSVRSKVYSGGSSISVNYPGFRSYKSLDSCYCPDGPTPDLPHSPNFCAKCGYRGRLTPDYLPGMPTTEAVKRVVDRFEGAGFDGMIDLKYPIEAYVKFGRVVGTRSPGAYPSTPGWDDAVPGAEVVHFGSDFVFVEGWAGA